MKRKIFIKWSGNVNVWLEDKKNIDLNSIKVDYIIMNKKTLREIFEEYSDWKIEAFTDNYLILIQNNNPSRRK